MQRTRAPNPTLLALISHIQTVAEREKAVLARELHDDLGGMLVAASMDLAWLEQHIASPAAEVQRRLDRLRDTLGGAVDIKRKIIEELRPTLLDNVGLFAALRWLVGTTCARAGLKGQLKFPEHEPHFTPDASIALFRVAQEALAIILEVPWVRSAALAIEGTVPGRADAGADVGMCLTGSGPPGDSAVSADQESYELATIRHRISTLGGSVTLCQRPGEILLCAWLPRANSVIP